MMSAWFFVAAGAAAIAALVAAIVARRRFQRLDVRRGVIESLSEVAPGTPLPGSFVFAHSGYVRYIVRLESDPVERVAVESYLPRDIGDSVELLFDRDRARYSFKYDSFLPALLVGGAAALSAIIAALLLHFEQS